MCENIRNLMKKAFDSEPVHDKKIIKVQVKSYHGKINTYFYGNKMTKERVNCVCLSIILTECVYRIDKY